MKKTTLFLVLPILFLVCYPSFCQKSLVPGYIVLINGDTAHGQIKHNQWDRNPREIAFMENGAKEIVSYGPAQLRSFSVAGEFYESATVDVDTSEFRVEKLSYDPAPQYKRSLVFLQSFFLGEKRLLYLKDKNNKEHFFIGTDHYEPLEHKVYLQMAESISGQSQIAQHNLTYKRQLLEYLGDCPEIKTRVEKCRYEARPLTDLFSFYYKCVNKAATHSSRGNHVSAETGIVAGATASTLAFEGNKYQYYYFTEADYTPSVNPALGLYMTADLVKSIR